MGKMDLTDVMSTGKDGSDRCHVGKMDLTDVMSTGKMDLTDVMWERWI